MPGSGKPFLPGHPKLGGRKPGQSNHTTQLLKDAILEAARQAGDGDLVAYLKEQAKEQLGALEEFEDD